MKYLFDNVRPFNELLNTKKRVILFTDYDGTLTPIREHPDFATLSEEVLHILAEISRLKTFLVGIITGRPLKQIKKLVPIQDIFYAANHGIEFEGPGLCFTSSEAKKARHILWHIYMQLLRTLSHVEGIYIEDKVLSISLHYRLLKKSQDVEFLTETLYSIIKPFLDTKLLSLNTGKMVYEIRPAVRWNWNKASSIQWLLTNHISSKFSKDAMLIYLGDDAADIEVFTSFKGKGIMVYVGNPTDTTTADYYVHSPEEVKAFLTHLYQQKKEVLQ